MKPLPVASVIAIDGPVASGKTTVGRALAMRLGYRFVDTGLMYRALTWAALGRRISVEDEQALGRLARQVDIEVRSVSLDSAEGSTQVLIGNVDVTPWLRSAEVEQAVSLVSAIPAVRRALVAKQRRIAKEGNVVMAGRDIGTVVLPDASTKVYLEAAAEERARRRLRDQEKAGWNASAGEVLESLERRDSLDRQRADSPLRAASDAVRVPTDGLSVEGVVERVLELVKRAQP
jgi:cytidylate kinase